MSIVSSPELLPWLETPYTDLMNLHNKDRLAHAFLLTGQAGLGKLNLALYFAHSLLCQNTQKQPCHHCQACHLLAAGNHPDLFMVMPEESKKTIGIEIIRSSLRFMANRSHQGGKKIIVISPAEGMNTNAANALLKSLEEPSADTLLLLVSHHPAQLLLTLKSRCQKLPLALPPPMMAADWLAQKNITGNIKRLLELAHGAPLKALQLGDEDALHCRDVLENTLAKLLSKDINVIPAAVECSNFSIDDNLSGMMLYISELLKIIQCQQTVRANTTKPANSGLDTVVERHKNNMTAEKLHRFYGKVLAARKATNSTANPNPLLLLESLFQQWVSIANPIVNRSSEGPGFI